MHTLDKNNENTNISEQHIDGSSAYSTPLNLFIGNNNKLVTVPILKSINHHYTAAAVNQSGETRVKLKRLANQSKIFFVTTVKFNRPVSLSFLMNR